MHKAIASSLLETTTPEPANNRRSKTVKYVQYIITHVSMSHQAQA